MNTCPICGCQKDIDYVFYDTFVCEACYERLEQKKQALIADYLDTVEYEAYTLVCDEERGL